MATSKEPQRSIFINVIGQNLEKLKSTNFGTKLLNKLLITYPEFNQNLKNKLNVGNINRKKSNVSSVESAGSGNFNPDYIPDDFYNKQNFKENFQQVNQNYKENFRNMNCNVVNNKNYPNSGFVRKKNNQFVDRDSYSNFIRNEL